MVLKTSVNRDKSGERGVQRPVDSQTSGRGPDQWHHPDWGGEGHRENESEREKKNDGEAAGKRVREAE